MTPQETLDEVAKEKGFKDWHSLAWDYSDDEAIIPDSILHESMRRYADTQNSQGKIIPSKAQIINFALEAVVSHDESAETDTSGKVFSTDAGSRWITIDELFDECIGKIYSSPSWVSDEEANIMLKNLTTCINTDSSFKLKTQEECYQLGFVSCLDWMRTLIFKEGTDNG